jgi:hypothetical protein
MIQTAEQLIENFRTLPEPEREKFFELIEAEKISRYLQYLTCQTLISQPFIIKITEKLFSRNTWIPSDNLKYFV